MGGWEERSVFYCVCVSGLLQRALEPAEVKNFLKAMTSSFSPAAGEGWSNIWSVQWNKVKSIELSINEEKQRETFCTKLNFFALSLGKDTFAIS